jgi:hypothetical protein
LDPTLAAFETLMGPRPLKWVEQFAAAGIRELAGMVVALGLAHGLMPGAFYYLGSGQSFGWAPFVVVAFIILRIVVGSSRTRARRRERDRNRERGVAGNHGWNIDNSGGAAHHGPPLSDQPLPGHPRQEHPSQDQARQDQHAPDFSQFDATYQPPPADFRPTVPTPAEGQGESFAGQRLAAEQSLKRRLDELDELRRSGRISADEYTAAREEIFRSS